MKYFNLDIPKERNASFDLPMLDFIVNLFINHDKNRDQTHQFDSKTLNKILIGKHQGKAMWLYTWMKK